MKALQTLYKNLEEAGRHEFLNWVRDFGQECHRKPGPEEACFRVRRHTEADLRALRPLAPSFLPESVREGIRKKHYRVIVDHLAGEPINSNLLWFAVGYYVDGAGRFDLEKPYSSRHLDGLLADAHF